MVRVILDGSFVYERQGAAYKYFTHVVPQLGTDPAVSLHLLPSPTGVLDTLLPAPPERRRHPLGWLIPEGPLRRWLARRRRSWRLRREWRGMTDGAAEATVFHSWFYTHPPAPGVVQLQTVHDMIPEKFPAEYASAGEAEFRRRKARCIDEAARLIVVSECTKRDLCALTGARADRIDVVPQGVDLEYFAAPLPPGGPSIDGPYFLQIGGRMKHKNFARLVEAFALGGFARDYRLVCAGEWLQPDEKALFARHGIEGAIRHLHWPDEDTLRALLRGAAALVYPSLYEGFGIPPLEAMASGTPVAASRAASIPEVCGEAVEYFDPHDPADMARAMARTLEPATARALREKGRARARLFPWSRTAQETLAVYRRMAGELGVTRKSA